jgi:hypothetical protein
MPGYRTAIALLGAFFIALQATTALAQNQTQARTVDQCYILQKVDPAYQAVNVSASAFAYSRPDLTGSIRFLVTTSYTSESWAPAEFTVDNLPASFWTVPSEPFSAKPNLTPYPKKIEANFASQKGADGKVTKPLAAVAVIPIFLQGGKQYCLVNQLSETYEDKDTRRIVQQLGTLPSSPVFATIQFEFQK